MCLARRCHQTRDKSLIGGYLGMPLHTDTEPISGEFHCFQGAVCCMRYSDESWVLRHVLVVVTVDGHRGANEFFKT